MLEGINIALAIYSCIIGTIGLVLAVKNSKD